MNNEDEEVQQHVEDGEDDGSVRNDHDERDDDDDDDDDDDAVVIRVEDFIENLQFENETYEMSSFSMGEDMINAIRDFTEEDLQRLTDAIDEEEQKKRKRIWIDLTEGQQHDVRVAERVTRLLGRYDLSETKEFEIRFWSYKFVEICPHHPPVVDHYLSSLIDLMPDGAHFECVTVPFLGHGDGAWPKFLKHVRTDRLCIVINWAGSDIDNSLQARGLVRSMHHLAILPPIELCLNAGDASPSVALLFQSFLQLHNLKTLAVKLCDAADSGTTQTVLEGLVGLASLSKSLKTLKSQMPQNESGPEYRQLLESVLYSDVLDELELVGGCLLETSVGSENAMTNESIKRIVLSHCNVEASGWSILHRFRGLQELELIAITSSLYLTSYTELLLHLPRLEAFSDSSNLSLCCGDVEYLHDRSNTGYLRRFCGQANLAEFTARMSSAPKLSKLTLETTASDREGHDRRLPSLADLVQHSKGSLTLIHVDDYYIRVGDANLSYIWTGLDASALTELNLTFKCYGLTGSAVIAFLSVLQRKRALRTFTGELYVSEQWDAGCLDNVLFDFITTTTMIKTFDLRLRSLRSSTKEYNVAVLRTVIRGLERNQSVTTLVGLPHYLYAVTESLLSLLQRNYTLERLLNYRFEEPIDKEIKWLLDLNRYKRRCLQKPEEVPSGCWLGVVQRIAEDKRPDVLYHFLRRMPHSALRTRRGYRRPAPQTEHNLQRQTLARLLPES